jgi:DNA-binding NarL/FixJ family response regulator
MEVNVSIVEDITEVRESIKVLLNGTNGYRCISSFSNAESAIEGLVKEAPNVAIIDISLPGKSGIELIKQLKPILPEVQFLVFTIFEDTENIFSALEAGATGYLLKNAPPVKLLEAITDIYNGASPMSGEIARKVISRFHKQNIYNKGILTNREAEILNLLSKGFRYKEVADKLFVSIETVRTHIRNIYEKLQVQSRTEAINKYFSK